MNADLSPADLGALKGDGDLIEYLLSLAGRTRKQAKASAAPADAEVAAARKPIRSPLHRPGAWPAGTRPAGSNTCDPDCDCALIRPPGGES